MARTNTIEILISASDQASSVVTGMMKSVENSFSKAGTSMIKTGAALGLATAPVIAGFASTVTAAGAFDESMTNVGAVLGKSKTQMAALNAEVLAIGAASREGPQAASEAFYDIVGGVADASTHMAILEASIATAEAGSASLGGTTSALIAIMNSYAFSADQASYASDVLTATVGAGVGSMEEFAAALPQVAGLASSLNVPFTDLGASMAFLTTKGFSASQSATQLKAMMVAMLNPNAQLAKSLQEVGFASGSAAIEQLGLVGAYQLLNSESPTFQDNMAGALGSVEALNGVISLTDGSFQAFSDDFAASAEGATAAARKIQLDSFAAQMDLLNSSVEALKIQIGMALLPTITNLVRRVQPVVSGIMSWAQENPKLIQTIAKVTAGVAALATGLTVAGTILTLIGGALGVLLSPLALVAGGVALLGLAIKNNWLGLGDIFASVVDRVKEFATAAIKAVQTSAVFQSVVKFVTALRKSFQGLMMVAKSFGVRSPQFFKVLENVFGPKQAKTIQTFITVIGSALDFVGGVASSAFSTVRRVVMGTVDTFTTLYNVARKFGIESPQFFGFLAKFFGMDFAKVIQATVVTVIDAFTRIIGVVRNVVGEIKAAFETGGLEAVGSLILDKIKSGLTTISAWARDSIITPIKNAFNAGGLEGVAALIMSAIAPTVETVSGWVTTKIINPLVAAITGPEGQAALTAGQQIGRDLLSALGRGLGSIAVWARNNIISPIENFLSNESNVQGASFAAGELMRKVLAGMASAIGSIASWVNTNILQPLITSLTGGGGDARGGGGAEGAGTSLGQKILNGIKTALWDIPAWVFNNVITPFVLGLTGEDNLQSVLDGAIGIGAKVLEGIVNALGDIATFVWNDILQPLITELTKKENLDKFGNAMLDIGTALIDGIKQGIEDGWDAFSAWFLDKAGQLLDDILGFFGIKSPSKVFEDIGQNIVAGLALGIGDFSPVQIAAGNMVNAAIAPTSSASLSPTATESAAAGMGGFMINGNVTIQTNDDPASAWDKLEQEARRRNRSFAPVRR